MSFRYQAHGLLVDSDVELSLPPAVESGPPMTDLLLQRGPDGPVPVVDPDGEVIARAVDADGTAFYSVATSGMRTRVRYPDLCEFDGDAGLREVVATLAPGRDPGVIPVMAAGMLIALHLRLRGDLVLHASAVGVGEAALAFVGASGMGKSTMATVMCAVGHPLLTDDVLRAQPQAGAVLVYPGSTETRLRDEACSLAASVAGSSRRTADGRLAVAPPVHIGGPLPLGACIVPLPDRQHDRVQVRRLAGARALMLLSRFPRIPGWAQPQILAREFEQLADLVARVPVFEARIPWGPPFSPDVPVDLLAGVGLDGQR